MDEEMRRVKAGVQAAAHRDLVQNACRSEAQLLGLLDAVPLAIGMSDSIGDADAMAFAARFYTALADGQSVQGAYGLARVQMQLGGLTDADLPILVRDPAVNLAEVLLVMPPPSTSMSDDTSTE